MVWNLILFLFKVNKQKYISILKGNSGQLGETLPYPLWWFFKLLNKMLAFEFKDG